MIREKENTVMKKTICSVLSLLITLSAVFSLAACGEDPSQTGHTQHEYDTKWSSDETYHWHAPLCDDTTELKDKAAHDYDADHVCTVCDYAQKGLGTLTVADVTAWTDVESEFRLVFADASKAEAVTYEYDREKITLNAEKQTVKAAADAVGPVQVKVRSATTRQRRLRLRAIPFPPQARRNTPNMPKCSARAFWSTITGTPRARRLR